MTTVLALSILAVLVLACGDGDSRNSGGEAVAPADPTQDGPNEGATTAQPPTPGNEAGGANVGGSGEAVLTIGDESWTFDGPYCALGPEATQNDRVSFSSGAFAEIEGHRVQLDATVQDPEEDGRLEGDGVIYSVSLNDVEDFQNPVIAWSSLGGLLGPSETVFEIDGKNASVEAVFDNELTEEIEEIPGSLVITCP